MQREPQGTAPCPVTCAECDLPITDDDRHTREDGADVHGDCCRTCRTAVA